MPPTASKPRAAAAVCSARSAASTRLIMSASKNPSKARPKPMLQIVIPLGGKAARFAERGHTFPKPLIEIGGRSMIELVLENLAPPPPVQFTFICRKEHLSQFYLGDMLRLLAPNS